MKRVLKIVGRISDKGGRAKTFSLGLCSVILLLLVSSVYSVFGNGISGAAVAGDESSSGVIVNSDGSAYWEKGGIGKVDVVIDYALKDPASNVLAKAHETVGVETKVEFLRSLTIPKEVVPGNYTFFVNLTYKDTSTTGEDYFMVKSKISYIPSIIQKRLVEILVWVFGTALLLTLYFLIRSKFKERYLEKKEEKDIKRLQSQIKKLKKES